MKTQTEGSRLAMIPRGLWETLNTVPLAAFCARDWASGDSPIETFYAVLIVALANQNEQLKKELSLRALHGPPPIIISGKPLREFLEFGGGLEKGKV